MSNDTQTRLTDIEVRMTHQDAAIEEITNALLAQEKKLETVTRILERLTDTVKSMQATNVAPASEETPPPHY